MKLLIALFFLSLTVISPSTLYAQPINTQLNNRFGIHILDEHDLVDAARLVNSGGGRWGYVTLVIREDEMSVDRWRTAFNEMKRLQLIPIVRIATKQAAGVWVKPTEGKARDWADFLNVLPWPVKERYVSLFNEPNHAKEWGGEISPSEYARISRVYWEELKKASFDFFVLNGGLDAAAPNLKGTMDSKKFFDEMAQFDPLIFTLFDGWASHSYPNPGFSGSPSDNGKMSIRGFEWEVSYLSQYHLNPNIPVFITETGWKNSGNDHQKIAANYSQAFNEAWKHPQVRAVTPFLLRYENKPFVEFSWKIPGTNLFYPYFDTVLGISKVAGEPSENN